jgi:hypothetical protein
MSRGLGGLGLDRELGMIMNANRPNPAGLQGKIVQQQKAGITPQLLDVLASQKLIKEKQDAKTAMMANAAPNAGTIAQQQDAMLKQQAVADLQREVDVAKQVGMGNAMMNARNQRMRKAALKNLTGAKPTRMTRGIVGAPVPKTMKAAQGGIVGFQSGALVPYGFNFGNQLIPSTNIVGTNPYSPRKEKFVPLQIDPTFTPRTDIGPRTFPTIPAMTNTKPPLQGPPMPPPMQGPPMPPPREATPKPEPEKEGIPAALSDPRLEYRPNKLGNFAATLRAVRGGVPAAAASALSARDEAMRMEADKFNIESDLAKARIANTKEANEIQRDLRAAIERGENRNALFGRLNAAQKTLQDSIDKFNTSIIGMQLTQKISKAREDFFNNPNERREKRLEGAIEEYNQMLENSGINALENTINSINQAIQALDFDTSRPATQI